MQSKSAAPIAPVPRARGVNRHSPRSCSCRSPCRETPWSIWSRRYQSRLRRRCSERFPPLRGPVAVVGRNHRTAIFACRPHLEPMKSRLPDQTGSRSKLQIRKPNVEYLRICSPLESRWLHLICGVRLDTAGNNIYIAIANALPPQSKTTPVYAPYYTSPPQHHGHVVRAGVAYRIIINRVACRPTKHNSGPAGNRSSMP